MKMQAGYVFAAQHIVDLHLKGDATDRIPPFCIVQFDAPNARKLELSAAGLAGAEARQREAEVRKGFSEAREKFRAAAAANPAMREAWNMVGYTSRRLGDYEESLQAYDKALALTPDYPEAIEYRAELFLLTGRFDEVKRAYAQLLQSSPSYAGVLKTAMQEWVARKDAPGSKATGRDQFASWVATL